jgi:hypothetical protein
VLGVFGWGWPILARVIVTSSLLFVSGGYYSCFKNSFTFLNLSKNGIFFQNFCNSSIILLWIMLDVLNEDDVLIFMDNGNDVVS